MNPVPISSTGKFSLRSFRGPGSLIRRHSSPLPAPASVSRRGFLQASAGLGGILLSPGLLGRDSGERENGHRRGNADPRPIPEGLQFFAPDDLTVFHVLAPGYPGFGMDPATNDASVITDFNGDLGITFVAGMGTHTDRTSGTVKRLPFEVDMRFMKGTYVAMDGKRRHRTFAFI